MDRNSEKFVERMGLASEADGLSRTAGRLFAALLLSEAPRSLDELAESLDVSKAGASVEARRLLDRGLVERVGKPGDRRDYYELAPDFFERVIRHRVGRWAALHALVNEMREASPALPATVRDRFAYVDEIHAFVLARVEQALADWSERATRGAGRSRPRRTRAAASERRPPKARPRGSSGARSGGR